MSILLFHLVSFYLSSLEYKLSEGRHMFLVLTSLLRLQAQASVWHMVRLEVTGMSVLCFSCPAIRAALFVKQLYLPTFLFQTE